MTCSLIKAIKNNDFDTVKLHKDEINYIDNYNFSPLFWACRIGNYNIIKFLLDNNCKIIDSYLGPPLLECVKRNDIKATKLLLNFCEADVTDTFNCNALFWAIENNNDILIDLFIDKVNINHQDHEGNTVLFYTSELKIIKKLLIYDINPHLKNKNCDSFLDVTSFKIKDFITSYQNNIAKIKIKNKKIQSLPPEIVDLIYKKLKICGGGLIT